MDPAVALVGLAALAVAALGFLFLRRNPTSPAPVPRTELEEAEDAVRAYRAELAKLDETYRYNDNDEARGMPLSPDWRRDHQKDVDRATDGLKEAEAALAALKAPRA